MDDVILQYLQSVIAIQLGVTAALPFQIRLTPQRGTRRESEHVPDIYLRLAFAVVIGATIFKSLAARSSRRELLSAPSRVRGDPRPLEQLSNRVIEIGYSTGLSLIPLPTPGALRPTYRLTNLPPELSVAPPRGVRTPQRDAI